MDVLVHFHPELPKDPRTLLSTTKVDGIRPIAGGLYYHFGIAVAIKSALALDPKLKNCDTIHLQLNVDGLPLFKSSNVVLANTGAISTVKQWRTICNRIVLWEVKAL